MNKKKKIGVFSFTCDEGCSINMLEVFNNKLFDWLEKVEFSYFLSLKDAGEIKDFDIVLIEGVVSSKKDMKELKIRENTKTLIAMGNCAISVMPSGQRNFFNKTQQDEIHEDLEKFDLLPKCLALKDVVRVDDEIPGCPINEEKFINIFEKYI